MADESLYILLPEPSNIYDKKCRAKPLHWKLVRPHRRRIKTEAKARVVVGVWGTYLNAALTI